MKLPATVRVPSPDDFRTWGYGVAGQVRAAAYARVDHARNQHWSLKALKALIAVSLGAMAVAASTSASDHHIRADGSKAPPDERPEGDPGGKPTDDVGQRKDAGEKTDPDSESNPLDEAGTAAG